MQVDGASAAPARLPRPLVVLAWLIVALGLAGFMVVRAREAAAPSGGVAEGSFWEARNGAERPLTLQRMKDGLSLNADDHVSLLGLDHPMRRLKSLVLQVRADTAASIVEVALREHDERSYAVLVVPADPVQVVFQYRMGGSAPVPLVRATIEGHTIAWGTPFEIRVDAAEDRFDVAVDGRPALSCSDARLSEGRTSMTARRGRCSLLSISAEGVRTSQAGLPVPYADADDLRSASSAAGWRAHAESLAWALGALTAAGLYLALLCLGRPGLGRLLTAAAVGLVPIALLFAVAHFVSMPVRPGDLLMLAVPGLVLAVLVLRPFTQARTGRPAWQRALRAAVAVVLLVVAGYAVQQRHAAGLVPQREAEQLALAAAASSPPASAVREESLRLDAANALVLPDTYRDFDLHASVTLAPDSLLEVRLRATKPPSCRGVALWLPSDARLSTRLVREDSEACEGLGSEADAVPAGQPIDLSIRVRGHEFEATAGERRVAATDGDFPTGSVVLLAARGAVEVRALALDPVDLQASADVPGTEWTAAVALPALLVLAVASLAALLLGLPWLHLIQACAFAALAFAAVLLAAPTEATLAPDDFNLLCAVAAVLLLVPCFVAWRSLTVLRATLLVLAVALAVPVAVVLASPPLLQPSWLAWSGPRLEDDLAYLQHPVLRIANGYLADHSFRGRQFTLDKPAGTQRVMTMGGSTTWGYGLADGSGQDYPSVLEGLLDAAGAHVEVLNGACLGATGERQFRLLRDGLLVFEPDVVTFSLFYNECFALTAADEAAVVARVCDPGFSRSFVGDLRDSWRFLEGKGQISVLDQTFRRGSGSTLEAWRELGLEPGAPDPAARYASLLRRFAELGRERGFCLVLIKEPTRDERVLWKDEFYAAIDVVAREYGLAVVDPAPALRAAGGKELFVDPIHLRPHGLAVVAEQLAPAVRACLAR